MLHFRLLYNSSPGCAAIDVGEREASRLRSMSDLVDASPSTVEAVHTRWSDVPVEPMAEKTPPAQGPPPGMRPEDFPDGGWTAWLTVAGAWCCNFTSFGWVSSIGIFQTYYSQNQLRTYSPSAISWILSAEVFMLQAMAPVFGKLFDSYGSRGLLWFGTFMHVFGLMMMSLGKEYYQLFLAQSICSGLGASALFYASSNAATTWFFKRRAFAMGIVASGSSLGGLLLP